MDIKDVLKVSGNKELTFENVQLINNQAKANY